MKKLAWYFSDESRKLRHGDGRKITLGVTHHHKGPVKLCESGLHGSERILDALQYAPWSVVYQVELSGNMDTGDDKIAARHRKYLAGGIDISDILREFARRQALSVAHLWDMPEIVRRYLETGDEELRSAAWDAAWAATRSAAWDAAWSAARSAAWAATRSAAWDAAWSATQDAARAAARAAAWAASWAAAWDAAWADARAAANEMLEKMVNEYIARSR